ncbi:hypothetical protein LCGC14_2215030 [marine sediment metagenome]|uniref:Uncharacterized protein n=1 Tax=marine sediment metagenome TaxID=412755 RepID=A0A0F9DCU4_9ZZZZ
MAATKRNEYAGSSPFQYGGNTLNGVDDRAGQSFIPATTYSISSAICYLNKNGTPTGDITLELYLCDAAHKPIGGGLTSGTFDSATLVTSPTWAQYEITFDAAYDVLTGVEYALIMKLAGADGANWVTWQTDDTSPSDYLEFSTNAGSSWAVYATHSHRFETWGSDPVPTDKTYSRMLVAVSNQEVWYESSVGTMGELTDANGDIEVTAPLTIFEAYQKVFFTNKSHLKVADFTNVKLTTDALGANPPDPGTLLTGGTTGAKMIVDYMTSLTGACTIYGKRTTVATFSNGETVTGTDDGGNAISFATNTAELSGPFWYTWTAYGQDTSYGTPPDEATLSCLYRGRGVVSGNPAHPNEWYMTRQGRLFDFQYNDTDARAAVIGNNTDAGEIGDVVTCLIPYKDDYLIFGCASSIWLLAGDPRRGGTIGEFSLTTGIFGARSFCWDDEDNLYFWGVNGIYKANVPGNPTCITKDALPNIVVDEAIDASIHRISMAYDKRLHGIHVCITVLATGVNSNYFYDLASEGFFPESYPEECGVLACLITMLKVRLIGN